MAPNIRNRISMQPMRSRLSWSEGSFPCFLVGGHWGEKGVFFSKFCLVWRVECSLSTWTVEFPCKNFFGGCWGPGCVKAKSSQISDMFPKEFPITPHFYLIFFGKCCPLSPI